MYKTKKINRRGFTLVELLVTILILGLVLAFSTYGIIKLINNSKEEAYKVTAASIKEAARLYSGEASPNEWKDISGYDHKYFCVTIIELINKGFLKEKDIEVSSFDKNTYIAVKKNKITETVDKEEFVKGDGTDLELEGICTGTIRNESITSKPELGESTKYTDQINVSIKADVVGESTIKEKKCYYGKSTNNINNPEDGLDVVDNECVFENLEDNTDYYVKVCMTTEKNSRICSATKNIKTYEVQKPTIKKPSASINIEFDDSNIREGTASHYLYSTISGTVDKDVYKCDLIDDVFNCDNSSTTTIDGGIWYKTNDKKINIEYLENEAMSPVIEAQTRDGSNNKAETSYEIHKVNIIFNTNFSTDKGMIQETTVYKGSEYNEGDLFLWRTDSDGVIYRKYDGIDNDYTKYFFSIDEGNKIKDSGLPNYNNKDYMKITQEGYSATSKAEWICIGGDCKIGDTYNHNDNSYTSNDFCKTSEEDCTAILGVNWQLNKVYIKFDVNGGTIKQDTSDNSRSYTWATNNDIIERTLNGKTTDTFFSIDYNSTGNLPNYNNDKYINVTKSGYIAAENNEWKCLSSDICGNNTYNHTVDYSADAFCDNISEKNCEVTLGVNWQAKIYSIEYDLAGGSISGDGNPNSYTIESNDITLKNPTKAGYTFTGWKGSNGTTPSKTVTISKGSTGNKSYTANWRKNKVYIKFNVNGGTITKNTEDSSNSYMWTTNNNDIIERTLNGTKTSEFFSIDYDSTGNLPNYDNGKYIEITKKGYIAAENNEWICLSSDICGNNTYNDTLDYSADAFCDNISEKNCEVTLGVNWVKESNPTPTTEYKISYNLAGGSVSGDGNPTSYTKESSNITLKSPTKTGYTFTGWTGSNGITPSTSVTIAKGSTGDKSYTANWRKNKVYIKFNVKGGTITKNTEDSSNSYTWTTNNNDIIERTLNGTKTSDFFSIDYDSTGNLPNYDNGKYIEITKKGYIAAENNEWICLSDICKNKTYNHTLNYSADAFCDNISEKKCDVTLGVNWQAKTYSIEYDLAGGSVSGNPSSYKIESPDITLINPTKTGYTFTGWTGSNGTTPSKSVTISKGSTGNKSYTANWRINKVNINYKVNEGIVRPTTTSNSGDKYDWKTIDNYIYLNGSLLTTSKNYGTTKSVNLNNYNNDKALYIARDGYNAKQNEEWKCISSNCNKSTYNHATDYDAKDICDASKGDCTIVVGVNWQAKSYSITYNLAGGSVSGNPNSYTIESDVITLKNPTKTGYTFTGWTDSNGRTKSTVKIPTGSTGNKSYTANWTDKVSGERYYTESKSPFFCDKFYITSCSIVNGKEQCNYNEKNNITSSGTVMRNVLALDISVSKCGRTYYVNASSGINCYKTPSYNANVIQTFGKCFAVSGGEISLTNNNSQGSGWYYSIGYDCYFPGGTNISDTLPSSCTSTQSGPCGKCVSNKDCESNRCVTDGCANSDGSYNCCSYSSNSSDIPALCK